MVDKNISFQRQRKQYRGLFQGHADFKYQKNLKEFDVCLDFFQRRKKTNSCHDNFMGENTLLDKLIVMDDVSGFDGKFENFKNFLTESRKYGVTCVSISHTIYPTRNNWQKILSQTKVFNIFLGSIQGSSVVKILSSYYGRNTHEHIPQRDLLFNKLYFNKSSSNKKQCLAIDTRNVNGLGPARFRTGADNNKEQACYYNRDKKDKTFNCFLALRKQTSTANKIIFSIVNLIDSSNKKEDIYFKINNELREFNNGIFQYEPRNRRASYSYTNRKTTNIQQRQQQRQQQQ